jgi:hypothetical protein
MRSSAVQVPSVLRTLYFLVACQDHLLRLVLSRWLPHLSRSSVQLVIGPQTGSYDCYGRRQSDTRRKTTSHKLINKCLNHEANLPQAPSTKSLIVVQRGEQKNTSNHPFFILSAQPFMLRFTPSVLLRRSELTTVDIDVMWKVAAGLL